MFRLLPSWVVLLIAGAGAFAQTVEVVPVRSNQVERTVAVPGELLPFQRVTLHARVNGYAERVLVDRGSAVRAGQLLVTIAAPEIAAQVAEAESRAAAAESEQAQAESRLAGTEATLERLRKASATPGAIAGNELIQAEKTAEAARAAVRSASSAVQAARAAVQAVKQTEQYRNVTAPFAGVITERLVHPGALVGPGSGDSGALLVLEQVSRLRLVVPVPEADAAGIRRGVRVPFRVPAYPNRTFSGTVARIGRSLDAKTRTMPVELDVANPRQELAPGMFPEVMWPAGRGSTSLVVPRTAVVSTTERTFVIRVTGGRAEWINVRRGAVVGDDVEIFGGLAPGDMVVRRANDEIRDGARLNVARK